MPFSGGTLPKVDQTMFLTTTKKEQLLCIVIQPELYIFKSEKLQFSLCCICSFFFHLSHPVCVCAFHFCVGILKRVGHDLHIRVKMSIVATEQQRESCH